MAQHLTRKELKKDQIREGFVHGAEAVASHPLQLWSFGIAALVVVIAVLGWRFYTQTQRPSTRLVSGPPTSPPLPAK